VASCVIFDKLAMRNSEYRKFNVSPAQGGDDYAAMREALVRRYSRIVAGEYPPPDLLVIDGGSAQVAAAVRALEEVGVVDVAVAGLAKRLEEVWLPGDDSPVILPRTSEGLYLLQRIRDEAHRFAITYHRKKRSAALTVSELDGIPGLGQSRRATLLRHFGSVRKLRAATVSEIAALPGFGQRTAESVYAALHQDGQDAQPQESQHQIGQDQDRQDAQQQDAQRRDAQRRDAQLTGGKT